MMIIQSFENGGQNSLGHLLTNFDWMVTVLENFGLDNRNDPVLLTDWSVSGQNVCVFNDSYNRYKIIVGRNSFDLNSNFTLLTEIWWSTPISLDSENATPFCEITTIFFVLGASFIQTI